MRRSVQRPRQSNAEFSNSGGNNNVEPILPPYEPPSAPLSARDQQALKALQNKNDLTKLKQHLRNANGKLGHAVQDNHESYGYLKQQLDARHAKLVSQGHDADEVLRERIENTTEYGKRVEALDVAIEAKVRSVIDSQARLMANEKALEELSANVSGNNGRVNITATQSTLGASQFRSIRVDEDEDDEGGKGKRGGRGEEGEEEEEEEGGGRNLVGIVDLLQRKAEEHEKDYANLSMKSR
jgi:hypothetical protein